MAKSIIYSVSNFRSLVGKNSFEILPITILTGKNSSGKSSLIRSVQAMKEHIRNTNEISFRKNFLIDKSLSYLGDFLNLLPFSQKKNNLSYSLPISMEGIDENLYINVDYGVQDISKPLGVLKNVSITRTSNNEEVFYVRQKNNNCHELKINLHFFFNKYKQQCNLMKEYLDLLNSEKYESIKEKEITINKYFLNDYKERNNFEYFLYDQEEELINIEPSNEQYKLLNQKWGKRVKSKITEYKSQILSDFVFNIFHYETPRGLSQVEKQFIVNNYDDPILLGLKFEFNKYIDYLSYVRFTPVESNSSLFPTSSNKRGNDFLLLLGKTKFLVTSNPQINEWKIKQSNLKQLINDIRLMGYIEFKHEKNPLFNDQMTFFSLKEVLLRDEHVENIKRMDFYDAEESMRIGHFDRFEYFISNFIENNIISSFRKSFIEFFENSDFIHSNRAEQKRSYKDNSFGNLLFELFNSKIEFKHFVNHYLKYFEIGDEIQLVRDNEGEFMRVYIKKGRRRVLLSDMGYGVSQVLPIILQIVFIASKNQNSSKIFIEEPESNLHPAVQSKLADLFVQSYAHFGLNFIIETHSEYLIRKLQYLTAKGELQTNQSIIYYFKSANTKGATKNQVKKISISEEGTLSDDFDNGFFDEADKIAMDLFFLKNSQRN